MLLDTRGVVTNRRLRNLLLFGDTVGISLLLIFGGSATSPICAAYYLLVIHYGINSSTRQLLASCSLAAIGFAATLMLSSYWHSNIELGLGLIFGLFLITIILYREGKDFSDKGHISLADQTDHTLATNHSSIKLLFITNDTKDRHMLLSYIDSWGINVDIHNSSLRAFAELALNAESDDSYSTVIVDPINLDMDPIQFAQHIKLDSALSSIQLIHLSPEHSNLHEEQLMDAGYSVLLKTPIDKAILFDALHKDSTNTARGKNVTKFIEHYASKSSMRQPLDILLAISDAEEQKTFRNSLELNRQRVYVVTSGSEALDALNTHQFDMVILDFRLPDMEGKEIIKIYHYTYINEEWTPFIALVDEASPEVLAQCREAEVNSILVRPVEKNELLITVADIAASKTKRAENIDKHWQPPHINEAQIRDCNDQLLNTKTLVQIQKLSSCDNFLEQLTNRFNQDMDILMEGLDNSVQNNCFTDYKDLIYALKDSSCNLGADALHKLSLIALQINQREFQGQAVTILEDIKETLSKTKYALHNHALKHKSSATDKE
jgi:two-component system sensor histidine kinase RpfC